MTYLIKKRLLSFLSKPRKQLPVTYKANIMNKIGFRIIHKKLRKHIAPSKEKKTYNHAKRGELNVKSVTWFNSSSWHHFRFEQFILHSVNSHL